MRSSFIFTLAIGLAMPGLALAQGVSQACHVRSMCGGISPGGGRIVACLAQHRAELAVGCKVALADRLLNHAGHGRGRMAMGPRSGQQQPGGPMSGPMQGGYPPGGPGGPGGGPGDMDPAYQ